MIKLECVNMWMNGCVLVGWLGPVARGQKMVARHEWVVESGWVWVRWGRQENEGIFSCLLLKAERRLTGTWWDVWVDEGDYVIGS